MISSYTLKFILYLITIMCLARHLQIFTESKTILLINHHLNHQQLKDLNDRTVIVKSFSHPKFNSFTLFKITTQNNQQSLFVVTRNDTVLELELNSMKMINTYYTDSCSRSMDSQCEANKLINHLSEINLFEQKMMWFCYIIPQQFYTSPTLTNCIIPKNKILTTDITWLKAGYTSNGKDYKTFSVQTKDHIFIGSITDRHLQILRTKLPDIYGQIPTQDLITPPANFYFEKNSQFLEAFETDYEVYFVVLEPVTGKSRSVPQCQIESDIRKIYVTRLVRICKKDNGGVYDHNEQNFGTTAKADIVCPVGSGEDKFLYTKAISASWSNSKLYILFENQRNSPQGKVVCYYDKFAFKLVFDGPIRQPWIFLNSINNDEVRKNPLPNVCEKLDKKTLTSAEETVASSLSVNGLYRKLSILPVTDGPVFNLRNKEIKLIKVFPTGTKDNITIICLTDNQFIDIYSHSEAGEFCDILKYQLNEGEVVHQMTGSYLDFKILLLISTNKRLIKLQINNCEKFQQEEQCLTQATNICGWDYKKRACTVLRNHLDQDRWQRSACKKQTYSSIWSSPKICKIKDFQMSLTCLCSYCLDESVCKSGPRVQILNCSGTIEVGKWGDWDDWSDCSSETGLKKRKRICLTKFPCVGKDEENIPCSENSKHGLYSGWTQWFSISNTNIYNSFRAKCYKTKLGTTPILETREMFCENSCPGSLLKWSKWSDCVSHQVQYRLFNCSSLSDCPQSKIQLQYCEPKHVRIRKYPGDKENTYTVIHLVLATLVASIVWVFILIFTSIILLKFKFKSQIRRTKNRKRNFYQPSSSRYKREFSETSNDYLSSDLKSTIYDIEHAEIMSFPHTENVPSTSKNIYSPYPLTNEGLSVTAQI